MKKISIFCLLIISIGNALAQKGKSLSVLFTNSQPANPFSKGIGLVREGFHPGIEIGRETRFAQKRKHTYSYELRAGYFYHRFVQHGIPLYVNLGYSYRIGNLFSIDAKLGGGYLHSIPATIRLNADEQGDYKRMKGAGRPQGMATFELGIGYTPRPHSKAPVRIILAVQQRLQMKFIRSYVPILPYNTILFGVQRVILHQKKS